MSIPQAGPGTLPHRLRTARVLRVDESACEVWSEGNIASVGFATGFPSPRVERVSPGHLVAVATGASGAHVVVWRWYDTVVLGAEVLGAEDGGSVRLWEPAHGEVLARPRTSYRTQDPGSRAYASAGLPGADWWVATGADVPPHTANVELRDVEAMYTEHDLWSTAFDLDP
jgi:hypothetical protein